MFILRTSRGPPVTSVDSTVDRTQQRGQAKLLLNLNSLLAILNGPWFTTAGELKLVHYCRRDGTCCPGSTDAQRLEAARARAATAPRRTLFAKKPSRASENKWTKLAPAYDFYCCSLGVNVLLAPLARLAFGDVPIKYEAAMKKVAAQAPQAPGAPVNDRDRILHFNAVAGTRLCRFFRMVESPDSHHAMVAFMTSSEVGRDLSYFFMEARRGISFWVLQ